MDNNNLKLLWQDASEKNMTRALCCIYQDNFGGMEYSSGWARSKQDWSRKAQNVDFVTPIGTEHNFIFGPYLCSIVHSYPLRQTHRSPLPLQLCNPESSTHWLLKEDWFFKILTPLPFVIKEACKGRMWSTDGMVLRGENQSAPGKTHHRALCPSHISRALVWDCAWDLMYLKIPLVQRSTHTVTIIGAIWLMVVSRNNGCFLRNVQNTETYRVGRT